MCGIVGILGNTCVSERLVSALEQSEFCGYDSAGLAVMNRANVSRRRAVGSVAELRALLDVAPVLGHIGIAHTRWATQGAATEANAHPQQAGAVAVVQNGTIKNHIEIRQMLQDKGERFLSQTDTEVVARLCNCLLSAGTSPYDAVVATIKQLTGTYALAFLFESEPDLMIVAHQGAPLVIGYGAVGQNGWSEMYVGSDSQALSAFANQFTDLENGDIATLTRSRVVIRDQTGQDVVRRVRVLPATDKTPHDTAWPTSSQADIALRQCETPLSRKSK